MNATTTNFYNDLAKGETGEDRFSKWCKGRGWYCVDVTKENLFRKDKIDFLIYATGLGCVTVDVKDSYKDNGQLVIEECTNYPNKDGWLYTSKANFVVFTSEQTFIWLDMREGKFLEWWKRNNYNYQLHDNKRTTKDGRTWQSAFRVVPLEEIRQFAKEAK